MSDSLFDCIEPPVPGGRLRRSDWHVTTCTHDEATRLVSAHHYAAGMSNTCIETHGLYRVGGTRLYGIAMWLPPTRKAAETVDRENWRGVAALSRLCVIPEAPPNAASFLLAASMRLLDRERWPTLLTYADTRHGHTGAIYRATNWECIGVVKGADNWRHPATGEQRGRKTTGRSRTRAEMLAAGFEPLPPAPKIKFVHRVDRPSARQREAA